MLNGQDYLSKLAGMLHQVPNGPQDLGALPSDAINLNAFNQLQKMKLAQAIQAAYLKKPTVPLTPTEQYKYGTSSRLATGDSPDRPDQYQY